jgi:hypothetical protein
MNGPSAGPSSGPDAATLAAMKKASDQAGNGFGSGAVAPAAPAQVDLAGRDLQRGAADSYGANATEALKKGMIAGQDYAADQASRSAMGAGTQAVGYARASGLSPAQAALMAGQQSGTNYNQAYGTNLADATKQYSNYAQQMGEQGLQQQGLENQRYGIDVGAATGRYQADKGYDAEQNKTNQQGTGNLLNLLGTGLSALFSDENAKTDIKDGYGILKAVTDKVGPITFKYKPGLGQDPSVDRVGVTAQSLEKTPLAGAVSEDPATGLKKVDVGQLTAGNTAMISELSKKVDSLAKFFKEGK